MVYGNRFPPLCGLYVSEKTQDPLSVFCVYVKMHFKFLPRRACPTLALVLYIHFKCTMGGAIFRHYGVLQIPNSQSAFF